MDISASLSFWEPGRRLLKRLSSSIFDRFQGPLSQAFLQLNGGVHRLKAVMQLLKCVETHEGTGIAAASVDTGNIDQGFVRDPLLHLVKNPGFRENDECIGAAGFGVSQQLGVG